MFHPAVIAHRQEQLEREFKAELPPGGLVRYPVEDVRYMRSRIELSRDEKGRQIRDLTRDEQAFCANEWLLSKIDFAYWAERYCNPPEAPIWMGDLSFKSLGELQVGDEVIGWVKSPGLGRRAQFVRERLVRTRVVAIIKRRAPIVKVTMASGRVIRCTPDHLWSNGSGGGRVGKKIWRDKTGIDRKYKYEFITAKVGRYLSRVVDPVADQCSHSHAAGWLGGIYDGEGGQRCISQYEIVNPEVYARIAVVSAQLGINLTPLKSGKGYYINGGRDGLLRFLLTARPTKRKALESGILTTRFRNRDQIIAVEQDGVGEVVSMQTETGNYIAWGYASKNCTISVAASAVGPMYPLWGSQALILEQLGKVEHAHWKTGDPDGVLVNILKARQLGASTITEAIVAHHTTTHGSIIALVASDEPESSAKMFRMFVRVIDNLPWYLRPEITDDVKNTELAFDTGSRVEVGAGKSTRGTEGQRGQIGRSGTYSVVHLSELTTWENPKQIDGALIPAIPSSPRVFVVCESTAKGRLNWWHKHWLASKKGTTRFANVFIPWYAEVSKYWRPAPVDWTPSAQTLAHARRCEETSHQWMGHTVRLRREQLYWYETTRAGYLEKDDLSTFLEEFCSDDEECFQHAGRSIFPLAVRERIRTDARSLVGVLEIKPRREIEANP